MKFEKDCLYIWVGGSCDYGHTERAGGGAYIAQKFFEDSKNSEHGNIIDTFTCAEFGTTEFKMIFAAMNHAIEKFKGQKILFISNVQYILNFEKFENTSIKILPYHKFEFIIKAHEIAKQAMRELRDQHKPHK